MDRWCFFVENFGKEKNTTRENVRKHTTKLRVIFRDVNGFWFSKFCTDLEVTPGNLYAFLGELGGCEITQYGVLFSPCLFLGFYLGGLDCSISMINMFQRNRCSSPRFVKHPKCPLHTFCRYQKKLNTVSCNQK